jgi:tetratricopeptide (TPR) repeat protein
VNGSKRFRFLEPVRQLVQLQLRSEERERCEQAHADFFLSLAEAAAPELLKANQAEWLDRLQVEVDNLRAAIRWSAAQKDPERGLRLVAALWRFTEIRGYLREGRDRAEDVLRIEGADAFPALVSKVLSGAGMLAYRQADFDAAEAKFSQSLEIEQKLGNSGGIANALNDLGNVANMKGDFTRAGDLYKESLAIEVNNGNKRAVAVAQFNLGAVAVGVGHYEDAERWLNESLQGFRDGGNHRESAFPLNSLGQVAAATGKPDLAEEYAQSSLEIRKKVKDTKGVADSLRTAGWASIERSDYGQAKERLAESISLARGIGDRRGVAETLELFGLLSARVAQHARSVELFAAAEQMRQGFNYALPPIRIQRREATLAQAKETLGSQEYDRAWRRGMSASFSDAVDRVLKQDAAGAGR